jgi:hypothetical protein
MGQEELAWGTTKMSENRYNLVGWLAIAGAVIFPMAFVMNFVQSIIGIRAFHYRGPNFGPSDLLFIIFTVVAVYVLIMFRKILHEKYQFRELDVLITLAIIFNIFFEAGSLFLKAMIFFIWPISETAASIVLGSFMVIFLIGAGIIDIIFAVKLFKRMDLFSVHIKILAYITVISGIAEVSVILSPLALLLIPVSFIVYGLIFLRANQDVEFV